MNFSKKPNKKKEPYTYSRFKELGILNASPLERLLMWELSHTFSAREWLFAEEKEAWERKDMREFVRDFAAKIKKEKIKI